MSWVRIWIHAVFSTKLRIPYLQDTNLRHKVIYHIYEQSKKNNILIDLVNGYSEHLHCLILLGREQNLSKVMQSIKGESSYWINKNKLTNNQFHWQDDYWAVSISESHLERVRIYIKNQETHHGTHSFNEEIENIFTKSR